MTTRWCCRLLQDEFGPMDLEELLELAKSGTLGGGDLVRRETEDVWMVASKCPELRHLFEEFDPSPKTRGVRNNPSTPNPSEASPDDSVPQAPLSDVKLAVPTAALPSACERWIGWWITAGLMLLLIFVNWSIASATPTFPLPRSIREQLAEANSFFGTGPWNLGEYGLLWLDSLIVSWFVGQAIARRWLRDLSS